MSPLESVAVTAAVEAAVAAHLGRPWRVTGFTNLGDRSSHHAGVLAGQGLSAFAKLSRAADAGFQFGAELAGLQLLHDRAGVTVPTPVGTGTVALARGALLLTEAVAERTTRTDADADGLGRTLARLHAQTDADFGLAGHDGWFGPLRQDNRPIPGATWPEFFAVRRLLPRLRGAVDSGHLPAPLAAGTERVVARLPALAGPEPRPSLLHGDAQQHNFVCGTGDPVVIDAAPHYGHPEVDLALLDYFDPVSPRAFAAYAEVAPLDPGFTERRELWRLPAYLAIVEVGGGTPFGRSIVDRLAAALATYA